MKKRFFAVLLCVVMLTSMLAAITVSAAEGVIDRVSLSGNTTFYSSKVEGKTLNVTAYDAEGNVVSLAGKEITYTSSRPWVFSIEADGTITDNGYDGTTIVTATVDGVPGSTIMIKSTSNTAATKGFESDLIAGSRNSNTTYAYCGWDSSSAGVVTDEKSRIAGEKYIDPNYRALNYKGAWDSNETGGANIRVAQGWFYDDGVTNNTIMFISFANKYFEENNGSYVWTDSKNVSKTYTIDDTNGYIPEWEKIGFESSIDAAVGKDDKIGYYFHGSIATKDTSNNYFFNYNHDSNVARTEGWHQVTMILEENARVRVYIDGIEVNKKDTLQAGYNFPTPNNDNEANVTTAPGFYGDDFVFAQNLNTEEPEDFKLEAKSITLSRNETFIKSVDETKELVVTPLDKNGNEGKLPEGTTFTYESTRPWVLDIDDATGKFIDGGYDGTTKVTVTASNGMTASTIFIKNENNDYADFSYQTAENNNTTTSGIGDAKLQFRGTYVCYKAGGGTRAQVDVSIASEEEKAAAKIPGENYYKMLLPWTEYYGTTLGADNSIVSGYNGANADEKLGWYREGLRVVQGWFYDDGTQKPLQVRTHIAQHSDYLGFNHLAYKADLKADSGADKYYVDYVYTVTDKQEKVINRSKGWHQVTTILNDDMTFDVLIDGELLSSAKSSQTGIAENFFGIFGSSAGNFDEFVVAANPNTTKPMTITASAVANGTVSPALAETHVGKNVEFTITPDEGYIIDTITYNGRSLTATNNKVTVTAVDGADTLSVTFKAEVKAPSIKTTTAMTTNGITHGEDNIPAAITYIEIVPGNASTVNEAGILLGVDGIEKVLKAYASYTDETNYTLLTSGAFAIKVYGEAVNNKDCTAVPYLKYTMNGEDGEVKGEEASFKIVK